MDAFTKIIRLLGQLDSSQLDDLSQRIKALQSLGPAPDHNPAQAAETFVLDCISHALHQHGADYSSLTVMRRIVTAKLVDGSSFREKVPALMQFLQQAHPELGGQRAILLLGLEFLILDLRKRGAFVSFRTLMAQIHRVGPAIDAHFPSYAQAGLLRFVVEQPRQRPVHADQR